MKCCRMIMQHFIRVCTVYLQYNLRRLKIIYHYNLEILIDDPLKCTMNHARIILSTQMVEFISTQRAKGACLRRPHVWDCFERENQTLILKLNCSTMIVQGAQWLSGRVLDSRPRGSPASKHFGESPSLILHKVAFNCLCTAMM